MTDSELTALISTLNERLGGYHPGHTLTNAELVELQTLASDIMVGYTNLELEDPGDDTDDRE